MDSSVPGNSAENSSHTPAHMKYAHRFIFGFLFILVLVAAVAGTYYWQHSAVQREIAKNVDLNSQITSIKASVIKLTALNNGTVPLPPKGTLSSNQVGLVSDKIVFTLPNGWVKVLPSNGSTICGPGTVGSKPMICEDIVTVLPESLINNDTNVGYVFGKFQVDISVFQDSDGKNAQDWFEQDYGLGPDPYATYQSSQPINGYSAYVRIQEPRYPSTVYYAFTHNNYAVLARATYISAIVIPAGSPTSPLIPEDYSKYLPDIKVMMDSISFR